MHCIIFFVNNILKRFKLFGIKFLKNTYKMPIYRHKLPVYRQKKTTYITARQDDRFALSDASGYLIRSYKAPLSPKLRVLASSIPR